MLLRFLLDGCDCTLTWFQSPGLNKALLCDVFSDMPGGFRGFGFFLIHIPSLFELQRHLGLIKSI